LNLKFKNGDGYMKVYREGLNPLREMYSKCGNYLKREIYKKMVFVLASSLCVGGCSSVVINKIGPQYTPQKVKITEEKIKEKSILIEDILKKYNNLYRCSIPYDNKYFIKPIRVDIYSPEKHERIEIPTEESLWALYRNRADPKSLRECILGETFKKIYDRIRKEEYSIFDKKENLYFSYVNIFGVEDGVIALFNNKPRYKGLTYMVLHKEGKYYQHIYLPSEDNSINIIYCSDKPVNGLISGTIAGISYGLIAHVSLAPIISIPEALKKFFLEYNISENIKGKLEDMKVGIGTVIYEKPRDLLKAFSQIAYIYGSGNSDNNLKMIVAENKKSLMVYIGKRDLSVREIKMRKNNKQIFALVRYENVGGELTPEQHIVSDVMLGAIIGKILERTVKENTKEKKILIIKEKEKKKSPIFGPGSGSDEGGNVIGP